jgi:hypothetical protein
MTKVKQIKALDGYTNASAADIVSRSTAVQTNMYVNNANFPNPPVELTVLKTNTDRLAALIAEALDGSKKAIAERNKQAEVVVQMLRLLARYAEVTCQKDVAIFKSSGFEAASTMKASTPSLSENIRKIEHGLNSGQVVLWLKAVIAALSYEVQCAPVGHTGEPPVWTKQLVPVARVPLTFTGLTAGATYEFQVRILTKDGYSDWSDSVTFICT